MVLVLVPGKAPGVWKRPQRLQHRLAGLPGSVHPESSLHHNRASATLAPAQESTRRGWRSVASTSLMYGDSESTSSMESFQVGETSNSCELKECGILGLESSLPSLLTQCPKKLPFNSGIEGAPTDSLQLRLCMGLQVFNDCCYRDSCSSSQRVAIAPAAYRRKSDRSEGVRVRQFECRAIATRQ